MKEVYSLQEKVELELRENEHSRESNSALVLGVFERMGADVSRPFCELADENYLRTIESITRLRRKVQEMHPELRPPEKVEAWREGQQLDWWNAMRSAKRKRV